MPVLPTLAAATATLTSTGAFTDTQTIVIGGKTYTSDTVLTTTDGHFLIGANQTASHLNLLKAVNLSGVAGTDYATNMTINTQVKATSSDGTHTVFAAKIKGTIGNQIATTETQTNASFGGTTMSGGSGNAIEALDDIQDYCQLNSEAQAALANVLNLGTND